MLCVKWVTRENVHVDRVACPWLIKRFVDPKAEFLFMPTERIAEVVAKEEAIPFDVPNVELGHKDDQCSFDAIIEKYKLKDRTLLNLAIIVRAADTEKKELAPESVGLDAIATGWLTTRECFYQDLGRRCQKVRNRPRPCHRPSGCTYLVRRRDYSHAG